MVTRSSNVTTLKFPDGNDFAESESQTIQKIPPVVPALSSPATADHAKIKPGFLGRFLREFDVQYSDRSMGFCAENLSQMQKQDVVSAPAPQPNDMVNQGVLPDLVAERVNLHEYLLDKINLSAIDTLKKNELFEQIKPLVRAYVKEKNFPLNAQELDSLIIDITDEMLGLGPLEPLLADDTISDILINGHGCVYIERFGKLQKSDMRFKDETHLMRIINKIVGAVGRRVDEASPLVDARLPDGSRINVATRPVAVDGPQMSIRKFSQHPFDMGRLVESKALTAEMARLLAAAVEGKISVIVSGGTGSGKTTLLNALSAFVPHNERLITIEDAAELQLQQPHVVRMETRPPTLDGRNEVKQRDLVKNALRMRPDRIIVGEVRGEEAFDMLQAVNTGHEGSMTTIHANNPSEALGRLEQMIGMAGTPMTEESMRAQIASAISLIVQVQRLPDGTRRVTSITEVTGRDGNVVQMQEIMNFQRQGIDENDNTIGSFQATGIRPGFLDRLTAMGINIETSIFETKSAQETRQCLNSSFMH